MSLLKSDIPLTSQLMSWFVSLASHERSQHKHAATQLAAPASTPAAKRPVYLAWPTAQISCSSSDDIANSIESDVGVLLSRSCTPVTLSISIPSIMSVKQQQQQSSGHASRKRLSDASAGKIRWFTGRPVSSADHGVEFNTKGSGAASRVQKLLLKGSLDLNSHNYAADVTWFAKWEGQPAKLRFKWREGSPGMLQFDAQMAIRHASHKIRLTGQPHQLHSASIMLGPNSTPQTSNKDPGLDIQPLSSTGGSSSSSSSSNTEAEQPASRAFDQAGLQMELGWSMLTSTPILSATRRFDTNTTYKASGSDGSSSGSSSSWAVKQVKAAYDGKASNVLLSAAGGSWSFGMVFPVEPKGLLGLLPKPARQGGWPKLQLSITPELVLE